MRALIFIITMQFILNCSPQYRSGISALEDSGDNNKIDPNAIPFSEVVEKVFEPSGCFDCHKKFSQHAIILKTVIPGSPETSKLYLRAKLDMPPIEEGYMPLTEEQLQLIKDWIATGANDF